MIINAGSIYRKRNGAGTWEYLISEDYDSERDGYEFMGKVTLNGKLLKKGKIPNAQLKKTVKV